MYAYGWFLCAELIKYRASLHHVKLCHDFMVLTDYSRVSNRQKITSQLAPTFRYGVVHIKIDKLSSSRIV